ncbi:hypothetical protein BHM03_00062427 [Ensete ventricosum]|nr:hypothetical protein BHM03_00062427 [Ensete ventricosum]
MVGHPRPNRGQGPLQGGGRLWPGPASKGAQGQQPAREAGAARRGSSPWGRQPPVGTPACSATPSRGCRMQGRRRRLQGARKGLPPVASPAVSRGGGGRRPPLSRVAVGGRGSSGGGDGADGARGWVHGGDSGTHDAVVGDHNV